MSELKRCPFCEEIPNRIKVSKTWDGKTPPDIYHPSGDICYLGGMCFYEDEWQSRPIEDELQEKLDYAVSFIGEGCGLD